MTHEATKTSTRRVRFADSVGRELVTIFLVDLISNFYSYSIQSNKNPFHQRAIEAAKKSLALPSPPSNISHSANSDSPQTQAQQQATTHHSFSFRYSPLKSTQLSTTATNTLEKKKEEQQQQQKRRENFICDFTQPISLISFKERVRLNKVHLETCQINNFSSSTTIKANFQQQAITSSAQTSNQPLISISCTIRVLNLSYEKSVTLRYSTDDWHTSTDCLATYKPGSCDGWSDKFIATFTIQPSGGASLHAHRQLQRIKFAIKFVSQQEVFWDNNGGLNYIIKRE